MIKQLFFLAIVLLLLIPCKAYSSPVSPKNAQIVALNFFRGHVADTASKRGLFASLKYSRKEIDGSVDYYIFDISPVKGFVIVTADDNFQPVIAYSTKTNFDTTGERYGVIDWMDETANKIVHYKQVGTKADVRISSLWKILLTVKDTNFINTNQVSPLLHSTWNQNGSIGQPPYIYNNLCPYNSRDHEKCYTGCVATAMSQIMYYWKCPVTGVGSNSYTSINNVDGYNYGVQSANFSAGNFDWFTMPGNLNTACTTTQINDVATLMYDAGVAVDMNYGDYYEHGSGAYVLQEDAGNGNPCAQLAYCKYFVYNSNKIQGVRARDYSPGDWEATLEKELNNGRVIEYAGFEAAGGGHTWVCDGYETSPSTFFDMNWGWGSQDDGYFAIGSLNTDNGDFNINDEALIGIVPQYIQIAIPPGQGAKITGANISTLPHEQCFFQACCGSESYTGREGVDIQIPVNNTTSVKIYQISGGAEIIGHYHPHPGQHPVPSSPRISLVPYLSMASTTLVSAVFKNFQQSLMSITCQLN